MIVTAPAAFRYTYEADPEKHRRAAELIAGEPIPDADENTLPQVLTDLMRDVGAPSGVRELGYDDGDIDGARRGRDEAAAPARRLPARALRGGRRGDPARLYGELVAGGRFGRITRSRTLKTASSCAKRATGRGTPSKRPSPR